MYSSVTRPPGSARRRQPGTGFVPSALLRGLLLLTALSPHLASAAEGWPEPLEGEQAGEGATAGWESAGDDWDEASPSPWLPLSGFVELAAGARLQRPIAPLPAGTLREARLRLETGYHANKLRLTLKGDLLYDDLDTGWQQVLRELNVTLTPHPRLDLKAGRQVLTWGTGDYLFLNDLFPKDWQAFFSGRDDEYLKAPSDSLRASWYGDQVSLNLVWTPAFQADQYLTGERFSFFSPGAGQPVAPRPSLSVDEPDNGSWAARLYVSRGQQEWALYGYRGYSTQPTAQTPAGTPRFSRLNAWGASVLTPLGSGLVNLEAAYHDSLEDRRGDNPRAPNSQWRLLAGYQQEWFRNFTLAGQYYLEWTADHAALLAASSQPQLEPEKRRHLLTLRLNYRMLRDRLNLGLFTFYSPSDEDYYLRPVASYRLDDHWQFSGGANLFGGKHNHTFFGQLEENSNAYLRLRYNF